MEGKQYLCMVELYMEDGKLCADYANNARDWYAELRMLDRLESFVDTRVKEIHNEMMKELEEE